MDGWEPQKMSIQTLLRMVSAAPLVVFGVLYLTDLHRWLSTAGVFVVMAITYAITIPITMNLRCQRCGELAMMVKYGTSPFNTTCRRCGTPLKSMKAKLPRVPWLQG